MKEEYRNLVRKKVDGFEWLLDVSDGGIGRTLASQDTSGVGTDFAREKMFMYLMNSVIKEGMTCIDIGANIGYATLVMARNSKNPQKIYAIEPDKHNYKFLKANLKINGFEKVKMGKYIISNETGKKDFWIARHPNLNSVTKTKHSTHKETVDCITLENMCNQLGIYPNFLKMDIEGHEVDVFDGAYNFFKENDGETHILLEVHPKMYSKKNDFAKTLRNYLKIGFNISKLIGTPVSNPAPFFKKGYMPSKEVASDGWVRSLYENVDNEHAIDICTNLHEEVPGGKAVRAILVSRKGSV